MSYRCGPCILDWIKVGVHRGVPRSWTRTLQCPLSTAAARIPRAWGPRWTPTNLPPEFSPASLDHIRFSWMRRSDASWIQRADCCYPPLIRWPPIAQIPTLTLGLRRYSHLYCVPSREWTVSSLCSWKFWKIRDDFDPDGQLDSIAPKARSNPTARRGRNHLKFFKIFMNMGTELSTLSIGHSIDLTLAILCSDCGELATSNHFEFWLHSKWHFKKNCDDRAGQRA